MAYAYWKSGKYKQRAVFHSFFRRPPFKGGFTISCGLEHLCEYVESFHFLENELIYLKSLKTQSGKQIFEDAFLEYLSSLKLSVDIDAVEEGEALFPYEPMVRVTGPLLECQLLESPLLNLMNYSSLIATKAARVRLAAGSDRVLEFGMRRAQGPNGALTASRAAFIGGADATSNVLAGYTYGIPVEGTQAHSWIMAFEEEEKAFEEFAKVFPEQALFLVDTYDTLNGVKRALRVAKRTGALRGIRLDSGDLAALSIEARKLLNQAGFPRAEIVASNELDEVVISELKHQGAEITVWGVGTNLVTAKDQPALDGVYKLSALQQEDGSWKYLLKLSEQLIKVSNPGILDVYRLVQDGNLVGDILYSIPFGLPDSRSLVDPFDPTKKIEFSENAMGTSLLKPIFRNGRSVYSLPTLPNIRQKTLKTLSMLPKGVKRFLNPHLYPVAMQKSLYELKVQLMRQIRSQKEI